MVRLNEESVCYFNKDVAFVKRVITLISKTISISVRIFVTRFPIKVTKSMIQNNERRTGLATISYLSEKRVLHSSKPASQSFMPF